MIANLTKPSLGLIRAGLIQQKLSAPAAEGTVLPRVSATGRTGSGKSTLGNLMLGTDGMLPSDGRMDCTDAVHVVRFPHGLTYIDLPGVASDDKLENFNRVALGMAQNPQWPQVSELRFFDYDWREQTGQTAYPAEAIPVGAVAPDLILYLIAPQLQLAKDEQPYLGDLLRRYGPEHLVYVLNMFHGPSGGQIATEQNLADVRLKLDALYQEAGLVLDPGQLVSVDCRTGAGLADLLDRISRQLGPDRGQPLTEVIAYQSERAPALYGDEIRASVARYAAALAPGVPPSDEQGREELLAAAQQLAAFAWDITGQSAVPSGPVARALENLAAEIVHELRQEITEPILKKRSEKRYIDVPIEKRITEDDPPAYLRDPAPEEENPAQGRFRVHRRDRQRLERRRLRRGRMDVRPGPGRLRADGPHGHYRLPEGARRHGPLDRGGRQAGGQRHLRRVRRPRGRHAGDRLARRAAVRIRPAAPRQGRYGRFPAHPRRGGQGHGRQPGQCAG